ncbi:amino acid adenylation domain-containing protein [Actinomadura sp. GTD37]|uniref:amino acid adenylation domain-containing protein n=1 Tax=Actinomadura sp. GTD37 TaxID=1778030 RepID=UPI0035C15B4B
MSARQRRLWEQRVLDPDGPWHDVAFTIGVDGPYGADRLAALLRELEAAPGEEPGGGFRAVPAAGLRDGVITATVPALWGTPDDFVRAVASGAAPRPREAADADLDHWAGILTGASDPRFPEDGTAGRSPAGVVPFDAGAAGPDLLLAALAVVAWRWTRRTDLPVGLPGGLVRLELDGTTTLAALIESVRRARAEAERHHGTAEQAMEELGIRFLPGLRLMDGAPATTVTSGGLTLTPHVPPHGPAGAVLAVGPAHAAYDARRLSADTVRRVLRQTRMVIGRGAADVPLADLPLMDDAERATILGPFRRTAPPAGSGRALHEIIDGPADATAVVCGGDRLTYRELDRRSDRLARHLLDSGVRREEAVGVGIGRSADLVTAFLGVLKAGAAYLPLDPGHPSDLLEFMRADAGATTTVTAELLAGLDAAGAPGLAGPVPVGERDLAYVIYTSGSTGTPKGVQVEHRQIVHSTAARHTVFPGPYDSYLALAGPAFDALGAGIYLTLSRGGTLVLPADDEVTDPWLLAKLIDRERVTHFDGVPAQYAAALDAAPDVLAGIRCAVVAGEACPPGLPARHFEVTGDAVLVNEYGPTETTVWALCHRFERPPGAGSGPVPIGRPVAGALAYVLDDDLNPLPIGVPGELCVGGAGVAVRGYLGRPDTTARRFVRDPFGPGLVYRTGDLVRWRPDGAAEFLGRIDRQVKIRGHRVEPGEVEAALRRHPRVREVAVVPAPAGGHTRLVAYIAVDGASPAPTDAELAAFAGGLLPGHMVPGLWVRLPAMPRTRNGKLDRAALPPPPPRTGRGGAPAEPRTPAQRAVCDLLASLPDPGPAADPAAAPAADPAADPAATPAARPAARPAADLTAEVPAWAGRLYGPAVVTALLRDRFGEPVPQVTAGTSARRIAAGLRRAGASPAAPDRTQPER